MARSSDPLRLALASLACAALAAAPLPPVARAAGALPLILYLPGRCCLAATFPGRKVDGEMRVLAAALSLALVTLLGVVLAQVTRLGSQAWLAGLPVLCIAACMVAAFGRTGSRTGAPGTAHPRLGPWHVLSILVAVGLAGFAYADASRGALRQRPDLYTDFWIVPEFGQAPTIATAGVTNQEGREATYAIDVVARGAVVGRLDAFRLDPGSTRVIRVALPRVAFAAADARPSKITSDRPFAVGSRTPADALAADRVELRLFKDGDRDVAYRRVWVAMPAPMADKVAMDEAGLSAGHLSYSGSAVDTLRASLRAEPLSASDASARDPEPAARIGPVRDATHALDLSQAAALQAPAYDADTRNLGVAPDDATGGLRSRRFAPDPAAAAPPTSPE